MIPGGGSADGWRLSPRDGFRLWLLVSLGALGIAAALLMPRPYVSDENHFVPVIQWFGSVPWTQAWADYPEISTPLAFSVYAAWGKIFGYELNTLRAFSLILGFAMLVLLYRLCEAFLQDGRKVLFLCLALLVNPYLLSLCALVFTDIFALLLVLAGLLLFAQGRRALSALPLGAALLCRQYAAVFWIAGVGVLAWEAWRVVPRRQAIAGLVAFGAAALPLVALFRIWGGPVPPLGAATWYAESALEWKPRYFFTYAAFSFLYLLPALWVLRDRLRARLRLLLPALAGAAPVWATGVGLSEVYARQGLYTGGLAHRAVRAVLGEWELLAIYPCAVGGIWLLLIILQDDARAVRRGLLTAPHLLLSLCVHVFFLIMPLSHQAWEKYMLPLLPLLAIRLALLPRGRTAPPLIESGTA